MAAFRSYHDIVRRGSLVVILLCVALWLCLGTGKLMGVRENQNDKDVEIGLWTPGTLIEQTFVASADRLCRIDFYVNTYHPWDSPYLECRLFELETTQSPDDLSYEMLRQRAKEVRSGRLHGWLLSGHMFNSFTFASLEQSQNKRYLLSIRSPAIKQGGSSILMGSPFDRYQYFGSLFVDGQKQEGDLAFRVLYAQPRLQLFQQAIRRITLQKPWMFASPMTVYLVLIGYLGLVGGLFWWSVKR